MLISIPVPGNTVSSTDITLYSGKAKPKESKPGPKFAIVAGVLTLTFIFFPILLYFYRHYQTDII